MSPAELAALDEATRRGDAASQLMANPHWFDVPRPAYPATNMA